MSNEETPPPKWSKKLIKKLKRVLSHEKYHELHSSQILDFEPRPCAMKNLNNCKNAPVWWFPMVGVTFCNEHVTPDMKTMLGIAWKGVKFELFLEYVIKHHKLKI